MIGSTIDIDANFLLRETEPWCRFREIFIRQFYWTDFGHQRIEVGKVTVNGTPYRVEEKNERSPD